MDRDTGVFSLVAKVESTGTSTFFLPAEEKKSFLVLRTFSLRTHVFSFIGIWKEDLSTTSSPSPPLQPETRNPADKKTNHPAHCIPFKTFTSNFTDF
jgi:hypothetical protein